MNLKRVRDELEGVVALYNQRCAEGDSDGDGPGCLHVVVFESISRDAFSRWLSRHEGELRDWEFKPLTSTTGRVVVYSLPSLAHERTAFAIAMTILEQLRERGNATVGPERSLHAARSPTYTFGNSIMEPDFMLEPVGLKSGALPNLIVEVSHQNEEWANLVTKVRLWMGPDSTVQVAIGIRICPVWRRFMVIQRNPDFDAHQDDEASRLLIQEGRFDQLQSRQLAFPLRALYAGVNIPPALANHEANDIVIDLADLLDVINRAIP